MKPGDVAGVLAGQLVHTLIPEAEISSNPEMSKTKPVVIACWTDGSTDERINASSQFGDTK